MSRVRPFINSDMAEGIGLHRFGNDHQLLELVDAINVACGFHAGDPQVMDEVVEAAGRAGVRIGAHPGLPDLVGFGRRRMALLPDEVTNLIRYQVGALTAFLGAHGQQLAHIKPHGALYGMLAGDAELMRAAAAVNLQYGVPFFGLAGTQHETVCRELGVEFIGEIYVDLNYDPAGNLIIQRTPEITDPAAAAARIERAIAGKPIHAVDGTEITIEFSSICIHSDAPSSVAVARAVRAAIADG